MNEEMLKNNMHLQLLEKHPRSRRIRKQRNYHLEDMVRITSDSMLTKSMCFQLSFHFRFPTTSGKNVDFLGPLLLTKNSSIILR